MHNNVKLPIRFYLGETSNKLLPGSWGGEPYDLNRFITVLLLRGVSSKLWGHSSSSQFPCVWIGKVISFFVQGKRGKQCVGFVLWKWGFGVSLV